VEGEKLDSQRGEGKRGGGEKERRRDGQITTPGKEDEKKSRAC